MTNIISSKVQESLYRLLNFNNTNGLSFSILEFKAEDGFSSDDLLTVSFNHTINKLSNEMICNMELVTFVFEEDCCGKFITIVTEVTIPESNKKFIYMLENSAYMIASDYMRNHYKQGIDTEINIPEHFYDVRRKTNNNINFHELILEKIIYYLFNKH